MILPYSPNILSRRGASFSLINSLDFDNGDYLSRTMGTPTDGKKFTISLWVYPQSDDGNGHVLLQGTTNSNWFGLNGYYIGGTAGTSTPNNAPCFGTSGYSIFVGSDTAVSLNTWTHVLIKVDTTQSTAADRVNFYLNGTVTGKYTGTYPALNATPGIGAANAHRIGYSISSVSPLNALLASMHFIDGQALNPDQFISGTGAGTCSPIEYAGTYGNNGFWLSFGDVTNNTTTGQDDDSGDQGSGAGSNDWTLNGVAYTDASSNVPG